MIGKRPANWSWTQMLDTGRFDDPASRRGCRCRTIRLNMIVALVATEPPWQSLHVARSGPMRDAS